MFASDAQQREIAEEAREEAEAAEGMAQDESESEEEELQHDVESNLNSRTSNGKQHKSKHKSFSASNPRPIGVSAEERMNMADIGSGIRESSSRCTYESARRTHWGPFVKESGWDPMEALQWVDSSGNISMGRLESFFHWMAKERKVSANTMDTALKWAQDELNQQLAKSDQELQPG